MLLEGDCYYSNDADDPLFSEESSSGVQVYREEVKMIAALRKSPYPQTPIAKMNDSLMREDTKDRSDRKTTGMPRFDGDDTDRPRGSVEVEHVGNVNCEWGESTAQKLLTVPENQEE